jgi:zinc/manganese transport system substrate-binding protein
MPLLAALLAVAGLIAACGTTTEDEPDELRIVATTSIWGDVAGQVAGEDATIDVLIPVGGDAHDYQATPRQVASLQEADLVIANGLGLEEGLTDVIESAATDGANVLELAPELDPLPFAAHDHEDGVDHDGGDLDPHVWFDPLRVDVAVGLITDELVAIDHSVDWEGRAAEYSAQLVEADEEISRILGGVPEEDRKLVTNHDALGYLVDRYGFEVIAVVIPGGSTMGDPSSAEMAALVEEIEHEGVRTIFAETTQPTRLAEAVAAEVGEDVSVVELYTGSLGEPGTEADTLIGMLLVNANLIADAVSR